MVEVITRIKTAEENAEELRRVCRRTSGQMREDAALRGKRLLETEAQRAQTDAIRILGEAESVAKERLESSRAQSLALCEELKSSAKSRMDRAAQFIVERIVAGL